MEFLEGQPAKCYLLHARCEIASLIVKSELWKSELWNVSCEKWVVKSELWNVSCEMWVVKSELLDARCDMPDP